MRNLFKTPIASEDRPQVDFAGISLRHPLGFASEKGEKHCGSHAIFSHLQVPAQDLEHLRQATGTVPALPQQQRRAILLQASASSEEENHRILVRQFSLLYDFADWFVIDMDGPGGMADLADWSETLDDLLALRMAEEKAVPVVVQLSSRNTLDQTKNIIDFCRLAGIDAVQTTGGVEQLHVLAELTQQRLPLFLRTDAVSCTAEGLQEMLHAGALLIQTRMSPFRARQLLREIKPI